MNKYIYRSNELYHFGIKGMRWGIRRYQNPDGSLTPEGVRRYYGSANAVQRDIDSIKNANKDPKFTSHFSSKERKEMVKGLEKERGNKVY
jgi:hypothetical protein